MALLSNYAVVSGTQAINWEYVRAYPVAGNGLYPGFAGAPGTSLYEQNYRGEYGEGVKPPNAVFGDYWRVSTDGRLASMATNNYDSFMILGIPKGAPSTSVIGCECDDSGRGWGVGSLAYASASRFRFRELDRLPWAPASAHSQARFLSSCSVITQRWERSGPDSAPVYTYTSEAEAGHIDFLLLGYPSATGGGTILGHASTGGGGLENGYASVDVTGLIGAMWAHRNSYHSFGILPIPAGFSDVAGQGENDMERFIRGIYGRCCEDSRSFSVINGLWQWTGSLECRSVRWTGSYTFGPALVSVAGPLSLPTYSMLPYGILPATA